MFKKLFVIAMVLALAVSAFSGVGVAYASARTASWLVSVTYQNVGTAATSVSVDFYAEGSATPITFDPLSGGTLNAGAGRSFFIGSVSGIADGFRGNAVMSSSQPLVATVVQFSNDTGFKMRMLSNGFQASDGSNQYLIATTLNNKFNRTTVFSIQNTGSTAVTATVHFYDADNAGANISNPTFNIPANSSKYIELDNAADTGFSGGATTQFNGSAIVEVPSGSAVVAAASELYTNKNVGANFEGIPLSRVANTVYLATALCQKFGLDTYYAVQNASLTQNATITVAYKDTAGNNFPTTDGPYVIGPGQKKSITTCSLPGMAGFTGSATITSTGAPIAVIGKAQCQITSCPAAQADVFTIFLGETAGASKLAMPFVRWSSDANFNAASNVGGKQRAYLAVQNLESTQIVVTVKYYDKDGNLAGSENLTIPSFSKGNSNPSTAGALGYGSMNPGEFGYYTDGSFGGSAIIEAAAANPTAKFIAIVRVQHPGAGEDYNAVAVQ